MKFIKNIFSVENVYVTNFKYKQIIILGLKIRFKISEHAIRDFGQNNRVIIVDGNGNERLLGKYEEIEGLRITFLGKNHTAKIHMPQHFIDCELYMATENCYSEIESSRWTFDRTLFHISAHNCKLIIHKNCSSGDYSTFGQFSAKNLKVEIFDDCMFAKNTSVRAGDGHIILDKNTHEIINHDQNTTIGRHVWVGANSTIMKGVTIPEGCVVGANSVVTKKLQIPANSIIAGLPAKVIKTDILWDRTPECLWDEDKNKNN